MKLKNALYLFLTLLSFAGLLCLAYAWMPLAVQSDPLLRMPGTQPDQGITLEGPNRCLNCHAGYDQAVEPGFNWKGSMMAQAARDPIFYACLVGTAPRKKSMHHLPDIRLLASYIILCVSSDAEVDPIKNVG